MPALNVWLLLIVLGSSLAVVFSQHRARSLFIRLHATQEQTRRLELERTQLQMERIMLSDQTQVEQMARDRLGMAVPVGPQKLPLPESP